MYDGNIYEKFKFYDGYCINFLEELNYENLSSDFFTEESIYYLKKNIYLTV